MKITTYDQRLTGVRPPRDGKKSAIHCQAVGRQNEQPNRSPIILTLLTLQSKQGRHIAANRSRISPSALTLQNKKSPARRITVRFQGQSTRAAWHPLPDLPRPLVAPLAGTAGPTLVRRRLELPHRRL